MLSFYQDTTELALDSQDESTDDYNPELESLLDEVEQGLPSIPYYPNLTNRQGVS